MHNSSKPLFRRLVGLLVTAFAATGALTGAANAANDTSTWLDVEGRIQYGFYTEDARALADVANELSHGEGERNTLQYYYTALANYRLALVLAARDKDGA